MILQIDCGNTRLKWRLFDTGVVRAHGSVVLEGAVLKDVLDCFAVHEFECVVAASVNSGPFWEEFWGAMLACYGRDRCRQIDHGVIASEQFAYEESHRLGIDRCLVVMAVRELSSAGGLILDCGSAMTADFVDKHGVHLGGYIFPGVKMLSQALLGGTSKVHVYSDVEARPVPGVSTEECVANAVHVMLRETLSFLFAQAHDCGLTNIYITGGDAEFVSGLCVCEHEVLDDMVFEGMARVGNELVLNKEGLL